MAPKRYRKYEKSLGRFLATQLAQRNMTQSDLAEITNVSPGLICHIMTGFRYPSAAWVDICAQQLNLNHDQEGEFRAAANEQVLDLTKR